ncbi:hypothetical protein K491DRAFT_722463 [Lophiostoma macrostomum CBS 122681]|uniref:Uncharacterized protein n=1 Tax=Lophiostoma macrostomum CBS 122681 TaxID=1314788 RepID=A0A6A6SM69_9PLEO|nr:hypothetical protein K491DRAFT_722463 [Lophiostoma macrostomum CBS 122681]
MSLPKDTGAMASIKASNSAESPLLRIPGEIRNLIYEYASGGYIIRVTKISNASSSRMLEYSAIRAPFRHGHKLDLGKFPPSSLLPAGLIFNLGRICSQIRAETQHLDPYACNLFACNDFPAYETFFHNVLHTHQRAAIHAMALFDVDKFLETMMEDWSLAQLRPLRASAFLTFLPKLDRILVFSQTRYPKDIFRGFLYAGLIGSADARDNGLQLMEVDELSLDAEVDEYGFGAEAIDKKRIVFRCVE